MRTHGPGEKVLLLPNGQTVKVSVDDSGVATQIEEDEHLHAIVRPRPIKASAVVVPATAATTARCPSPADQDQLRTSEDHMSRADELRAEYEEKIKIAELEDELERLKGERNLDPGAEDDPELRRVKNELLEARAAAFDAADVPVEEPAAEEDGA